MGFDVQGAAAGCVRFHGRASLPLAAFVASFFLPVLAAHAQSEPVSSPGDEYKKLIKVSEDIQPLGETPLSSAGKQAYTDALIEAIDRYQNAVREHKNDDPRSRWLVWPGEGYRLRAIDDESVSLLALRDSQQSTPSFHIAVGRFALPCNEAIKEGRQSIRVGDWSASFEGHCISGVTVFRPVKVSDEARLARTIATGRQLILISGGTTWAFDLSGVPVLNAKIAAEAAGSHSDE
ncbi:hypothetical protein ACQKIE_16585 [Luteibacter sp. NPDC031894]|uniref:hypothetical protein n=1 Tax=Luteibacter sp. NPDC031894 TaxID=3390572 RepID=UPI003D0782DC